MSNIQEDIKSEIEHAHREASVKTEVARERVTYAIQSRLYCAALVEKAKQMHKQDINGFLQDVLDGNQIKAYLTLHRASKKRDALSDKAQLQLAGILDMRESEMRNVTQSGTSTFISATARYIARVNKTLSKRPVENWQDSEREQFKDVMKPIIELYEQC